MGSLMAGWDSPVADPNLDKFRRNKSLTRGEIEAFWKTKKQKEEEHLRDLSPLSPRTLKTTCEEAKNNNQREEEISEMESETIQKNGWWVSSNLAFLNEPPVIPQEGTTQRYASQVNVACRTGSTGPRPSMSA